MHENLELRHARLILQAVKRGELDHLLAFYQAHPSAFILARPYEEFTQAVERGQFFAVSCGEEILAASGIFNYGEGDGHVELGDTLVSKAVQGYGLQRLLFRLRIASVVATQGPAVVLTTAVDPGNDRSRATTLAQGFRIWDKPIAEAYKSCPTCPNRTNTRNCCCDFYDLPRADAQRAVAQLLAESQTGVIQVANKSGSTLEIDCAARVLSGDFRPILQDFVDGEVW